MYSTHTLTKRFVPLSPSSEEMDAKKVLLMEHFSCVCMRSSPWKKAGGEGLMVLKQVVMTFKRKMSLVVAMMKLMTRAHNEKSICFNCLFETMFSFLTCLWYLVFL